MTESRGARDKIGELSLGGTISRETVGKQLIGAADSIGAKWRKAKASGRVPTIGVYAYSSQVASGNTVLAATRSLSTQDRVDSLRSMIDELSPMLNAYLRAIGNGEKPKSKS